MSADETRPLTQEDYKACESHTGKRYGTAPMNIENAFMAGLRHAQQVSPIKEGGVQETAEKLAHTILTPVTVVTPNFPSALEEEAWREKRLATIIAKAFAGFVPREEMERWKDEARLQKMACEAVEGAHRELSETLNLVGSQIEAGADDCIRERARTDAAQAQNAHLQADNAKLREKAEAVCIAWDAQDSTAKMELVCDDAVHALFNLLASPSTQPPKSEPQDRGAPFDEEGTKGKV